ncbi:hypothetical protein AVEN_27093-1 [Araneus ventricosus]|uniref:Uncharacterized protein n=1 Tax=Araneus ventricosus TaxID=182803 RepID=A0A4Y2TP10_ARAVE|nr:hypothetical protein AVEN_27093-1 [Araneus ventricosus]
MFRKTLYSQSIKVFQVPAFWPLQTNCRGTLTCACCAVAGHESTAVEKCINCQDKHTSFSRSCPKWELEKEIVTPKFKNISFPEARRLVKVQTKIEVSPVLLRFQILRKTGPDRNLKLHKLKKAKRGLSQKDIPANLKKSAHKDSVVLGLADRGTVHKDLLSIFGGVLQVPDFQLDPSEEDEDLQMNCDVSATSPCVPPPSQTPTLS